VDGLQQQRHLTLLLLDSQRYLFQVKHPLAGVGVARGGSGLQLAGQRLNLRCRLRCRLLCLLLELSVVLVYGPRIHGSSI
jgi:hypothetical protein